MTTTEAPRFYVHTVPASPLRKIATPHLVVDRTTGETLDEYASKRAAQMDANDRNEDDQ